MVLAEHNVTDAAPRIARVLASPYPLARRFAAKALSSLLGGSCAVDVDAPPDAIRAALAGCGIGDVSLPIRTEPPVERRGQGADED